MLSAQNVATYVDVEYDVHASFLIRVAPGPNSALRAAYPGQNDRSCSFLIRVAPGPNSALLRGLPWACCPKGLKL
jgi:hypothetical protein